VVLRRQLLRAVERRHREVEAVGLVEDPEGELGAAVGAEEAAGALARAVGAGAARVQVRADVGTVHQTMTGAPAERWHMRQWQ
jgi:hypothetical protein